MTQSQGKIYTTLTILVYLWGGLIYIEFMRLSVVLNKLPEPIFMFVMIIMTTGCHPFDRNKALGTTTDPPRPNKYPCLAAKAVWLNMREFTQYKDVYQGMIHIYFAHSSSIPTFYDFVYCWYQATHSAFHWAAPHPCDPSWVLSGGPQIFHSFPPSRQGGARVCRPTWESGIEHAPFGVGHTFKSTCMQPWYFFAGSSVHLARQSSILWIASCFFSKESM